MRVRRTTSPRVPLKPLVLQGDRGLSQKGPGEGNASYYYAQTRMATTGTVTLAAGETVSVEGLTWLDREWSTSALGAGAGRLGLVRAPPRRRPRPHALPASPHRWSQDPLSAGSLVGPDGDQDAPRRRRLHARAAGDLESPRGGTYPTRWRVRVPAESRDLTH